jgi:hypothetical protein
MMLMLLNTFRRWMRLRVRPGAKRRQPPRARLEVTALEDRAVPAAYLFWKGTVSNDWSVAGNWEDSFGGHFVPGSADVAVLGTIAAGAQAPTVKAGTPTRPEETCSGISLQAGFAGKTLTIEGRLRLTGVLLAPGGPANPTEWNQNATITGPGALAINGPFSWRQGAISVKNLYVHGGGQLAVREDASTLTADNITIGASATGELSAGSMRLSLVDPMNQYLQLGDNTIISVKPQGLLEFWQTSFSPWQGGLSGGKRIDNQGLVSRPALDDHDLPLYLSTPIVNLSPTAIFRLVDYGYLYINDPRGDAYASLNQEAGLTELGSKSTLDVADDVVIRDGDLLVKSDVAFDETYLVGNLRLYGGNLIVGDAAYTIFRVQGDLTLTDGTVKMNVDGANNDFNDEIRVDGGTLDLRESHTTLQVTTDGQASATGNFYDILTATQRLGDDFGFFEWLGFELNGYQHQFMPGTNTYRLTKQAEAG